MKDKIIIKQISTQPLFVFTYLVVCPQTKRAVIIDPAGDEKGVIRAGGLA